MKLNQTRPYALLILLALSVLVAMGAVEHGRASSQGGQTERAVTEQERMMLAAFDCRVKDYLNQRARVKAKLPPLSKESTPEQIDAYQKKSLEGLRAMRTGTKPGYIFNQQSSDYFRALIKNEVPPPEIAEFRQTILEADTKGVPLKVNFPYPETKELTQIPPTLLLKLPQLPKEVKYRYVGRHLLLVDTDNSMIVDYMINALP